MEFLLDKSGKGYRCDQVDVYVRELRQEYRQLTEAYQELLGQKDAIAQALIYAQMTAQGIVASAQAEAEQIRCAAYQPYGVQPGMAAWR